MLFRKLEPHKRRILLAAILGLGIAVLPIGCRERSCNRRPKSDRAFPRSGRVERVVKVVSGTTFWLDEHLCKLLGVAESSDPEVRKAALEFSKKWFEGHRYDLCIANEDFPLWTIDGACLVWIGQASACPSLNTDLAGAGLVDIDFGRLDGYTFEVPVKAVRDTDRDSAEFDWKSALQSAAHTERHNAKTDGKGPEPSD